MSKLTPVMTALRSNLVFMLVIPVFWLSFVLLYQPMNLVNLLNMGGDKLNFNTTIIMCILLGVMIISRGVFMAIHRTLKMNWWKMVVWELVELLTMSLFTALYLTLMYQGVFTYFQMVGQMLFYLFIITNIFPSVKMAVILHRI